MAKERPSDGSTADDLAAKGIGAHIDTSTDLNVSETILPNQMSAGVKSSTEGPTGATGGSTHLPDEVDPEHAGLNNDAGPGDLDRELLRSLRP